MSPSMLRIDLAPSNSFSALSDIVGLNYDLPASESSQSISYLDLTVRSGIENELRKSKRVHNNTSHDETDNIEMYQNILEVGDPEQETATLHKNPSQEEFTGRTFSENFATIEKRSNNEFSDGSIVDLQDQVKENFTTIEKRSNNEFLVGFTVQGQNEENFTSIDKHSNSEFSDRSTVQDQVEVPTTESVSIVLKFSQSGYIHENNFSYDGNKVELPITSSHIPVQNAQEELDIAPLTTFDSGNEMEADSSPTGYVHIQEGNIVPHVHNALKTSVKYQPSYVPNDPVVNGNTKKSRETLYRGNSLPGYIPSLSRNETLCGDSHYSETHYREEDGEYIAALPYTSNESIAESYLHTSIQVGSECAS